MKMTGLLIVLLYVVSKVLFNDEGDVQGAFTSNIILYINALVSFLLLFYIYLLKNNVFKINVSGLIKISLIFYILGLVSTLYSNVMVLSFYNSTIGILYVITSIVMAEKIIKRYYSINEQFVTFINFLLIFYFMGVLSNIYFYYTFKGITDFFEYGIPSGFIALLGFYLSFVLLTYNSNILKKILAIFIIILSIKLNSFSSLVSIIFMLIFNLFLNKKYVTAILSLLIIIFIGFLGYDYLSSHIGDLAVNNKNAEAYLTGSGRFISYETAIKTYLYEFNLFQQFFGVGFMAERSVLINKDLAWLTDPHNAFILNTLGLGIIGSFLYIVFFLYPFSFYKKVKRNKLLSIYTKYWLNFHFAAFFFSFTSSYYLGRPSFLLIFSLIFFYILNQSYIKTRSENENFK